MFVVRPLRRLVTRAVVLASCAATLNACAENDATSGAQAAWIEVGQIGTAASSAAESLMAGDIALGAPDRLFVLDPYAKQVHVYSPDGQHRIRSLGRPGQGPGEFADPTDIAVDREGRLFALDRRNARVEIFDERAGVRLGRIRFDFAATDLCAMDGRLFVLGLRHGLLIHEVSPGGAVLRSFAPDPVEGDPIGSLDRGGGFLACGPHDEIVYLPALRPNVHRYAASTGRLLSTWIIPGYRRVRVERHESGGVLFVAPSDGPPDQAAGLVRLAGGAYLVQVGPVRPGAGSEHEFLGIRSFLLRPTDQEMSPFSTTLPRIMAVGGDTAYAAVIEPFPRVMALTLIGTR